MNNFIGEVVPSREEVVGWLREAADVAYDYSPQGIGHYVLFSGRADQVEAMQCETCKKDAVYTGIDEWVVCPWRNSGGCFSHEPKEIK